MESCPTSHWTSSLEVHSPNFAVETSSHSPQSNPHIEAAALQPFSGGSHLLVRIPFRSSMRPVEFLIAPWWKSTERMVWERSRFWRKGAPTCGQRHRYRVERWKRRQGRHRRLWRPLCSQTSPCHRGVARFLCRPSHRFVLQHLLAAHGGPARVIFAGGRTGLSSDTDSVPWSCCGLDRVHRSGRISKFRWHGSLPKFELRRPHTPSLPVGGEATSAPRRTPRAASHACGGEACGAEWRTCVL